MGTSVAQTGYLHPSASHMAGESTLSPLGKFLTDKGYVTPEQWSEAEITLATCGGFLTKILVEKGFISEPKLLMALVKQCKVPHARLKEYAIADGVVDMIPENVCLRHGILPVGFVDSELTVAMLNPMDENALDMLRRCCPGIEVQPILCSWGDFERATRRLFPDNAVFAGSDTGFDSLQLHLRGPWRRESPQEDTELIPNPLLAIEASEPTDPVAMAHLDQLKRQVRRGVADRLESMIGFIATVREDSKPIPNVTQAQRTEAIQEALVGALEENVDFIQRAIERMADDHPEQDDAGMKVSRVLKSAYDSIQASGATPTEPRERRTD